MILPDWSPERLEPLMPGVVLGVIGARRQGKSVLIADLLHYLFKRELLDLCFCFVGSATCNPVYKSILNEYSDDRLFFPKFCPQMVERLCEQQEKLTAEGRVRSVLLLIDDVVLSPEARELLCNCATRSRHFQLSIMFASVSWTMLPKTCRRSLDTLFLLSMVSQGDAYLLSREFARSDDALWALRRLQGYTSLVLECSCGGNQVLQQYRARHLNQNLREVQLTRNESCVLRDELRSAPSSPSCASASTSKRHQETTPSFEEQNSTRSSCTGAAVVSPSRSCCSSSRYSTHEELV